MIVQPDDPWFRQVPAEEAAASVGPDTADNEVAVGKALAVSLLRPGGPDVATLELLVTPDSRPAWGDFRWATDLLAGRGMSTSPQVAAPDVAYIKYPPGMGTVQVHPDAPSFVMENVVVATLVRSRRWHGWKVHGLGEPVPPERLPAD